MSTNAQYRELMRISRRFGVLLSSGVPILQSMQLIQQEAVPPYNDAFAEMRQVIQDGAILSAAMERYPDLFPAPYRSMIYAGERTGLLDETATHAATLFSPAIESGRIKTVEDWHGLEEPLGLLQFTHQFTTLLSTGVIWWGRCLFILEHEAQPPFDEVARSLEKQSESVKRWEPLSERMGRLPKIFSPFYRAMAQAGDTRGGNLSEIFHHLDELLQEDWVLSQRVGWQDGRPSLIINGGQPAVADWSQLTAAERQITQTLFSRALGMLLSTGITLPAAIGVVAHLLPKAQQEIVNAVAQQCEDAAIVNTVIEASILPGFGAAILRSGLIGGMLEFGLTRIADTLHTEITAG